MPIFCSADLGTGKYTALPSHGRIFQLHRDQPIDPQWFRAQLGKQPVSQVTAHAMVQIDAHWDRVAALIREGRRPTQPALNRYWQALPGVLEDLHSQLQGLAEDRQREREQHQQALEMLYRSNSFKLTAPLRRLRRTLKKWLGALRHD